MTIGWVIFGIGMPAVVAGLGWIAVLANEHSLRKHEERRPASADDRADGWHPDTEDHLADRHGLNLRASACCKMWHDSGGEPASEGDGDTRHGRLGLPLKKRRERSEYADGQACSRGAIEGVGCQLGPFILDRRRHRKALHSQSTGTTAASKPAGAPSSIAKRPSPPAG